MQSVVTMVNHVWVLRANRTVFGVIVVFYLSFIETILQ